MKILDCSIYKSRRRPDTYLFLPRGESFEALPAGLRQMLGKLEHVMDLSLDPQRKLAQSDPRQVIAALESEGYYLQLPPGGSAPAA